ncbi:MAG: murein transglycosylase A [Sphingomonadaceae bacterium]
MKHLAAFAAAAALFGLASCVPRAAPPASLPAEPPPVAGEAANALEAGIEIYRPYPPAAYPPPAAARALAAFRISCPALLKRDDASGLSRTGDWAEACAAAANMADAEAPRFFARHFVPVRVGAGDAFVTGYFEPQIRASRTRRPGYEVPIYRVPDDLVRGSHADGSRGRGRYAETGAFVLYHDRAAIEAGALAGRGLELAWAADPVDLFFLQIQGSGRLLLPGGEVMRIGYADQNGREYVAIGRLMKERGLLGEGQVSMQKIVDWLRANAEEGAAIMRENKSYIFFEEREGPGPLGALGLPVTPRASLAADPRFVPLGAPVLLDLERPISNGLWIAQDTGGAIKGANRFDTFWGAGEEARAIAGGLQSGGSALLLLPRASAARLGDAQAER